MGVYDVRKTIKESIAWELPGNIPYEAKTRLINQFTDLWSTPAEECLTSINDVLDDVVQQLTKTHFGRFRVLQDMISDLIRPDIEEYKNKTNDAVKETLGVEISPFYTQNDKDFENLRERWLVKYRQARRHPGAYRMPRPKTPQAKAVPPPTTISIEPSPSSFTEWGGADVEVVASPGSQALKYLAAAGYKGLTVDDLARLLPRDHHFEEELVVMADVRAYFTIACKRIIDHVPLKIQQSLHQALAERLSVSLLQRLVVDATSTVNFADRMKELVSEDPAIEAERARLETKRTRLQKMQRKLADVAA
ncbi:hypothetical protein OG21DRAFT_1517903 [Imleria badia]|nr:hypothetical protein OG21DRAFT_1517903 [Imleria badia]